jgi:hypothetical protein
MASKFSPVGTSSSGSLGGDSTAPSDALMVLLSPDGYYTYLGISKHPQKTADPKKDDAGEHPLMEGDPATLTLDEDMVKKNYRKLSLKHHPDKRGGDVATFRVLNRAQRVLLNPKLRQQYEILGIDLDDDEEHTDDGGGNTEEGEAKSTAQGIVQEIAGQVLASLIQLGVRTGTSRGTERTNWWSPNTHRHI